MRRTLQILAVLTGLAVAQVSFAESVQYIVKVKKYQNNLSKTSVNSIVQAKMMSAVKEVNQGNYQIVTVDKKDEAKFVSTLKASDTVEYAIPNRPVKANFVPNDPKFSAQTYLSNQNYADPDVSDIWNITSGQGNVTVAVIDTGLLYNNPDLNYQNVLPGYNFISSAAQAGNGVGRSSDATDLGDWVDSAYLQANPTFGCMINNSSWHGTRVASLIGAPINDGVGIAGVANVKILPIRVLGKCGGQIFDAMQGAMWAAGIHIDGVPDNTHPAKVINMSLSTNSGSCTPFEQDAIDQINAKGSIVVASAGNNNGAVGSPANCSGVVAVGAVDHLGYKSSYSNFGPEVSIMARGGDITTYGFADSITNVTNNGTREGVNSYSYDRSDGTSFSAPIVAGSIALMNDSAGNLSLAQVQAALSAGANTFPTGACTNGTNCGCNSGNCGVGIFNAYKSFQYLYYGADSKSFTISGLNSDGLVNRNQTINVVDNNAYSGVTVSNYTWSATDQKQNVIAVQANGSQASILTPNRPLFITLSLVRNMSDGTVRTNHFTFQSVEHAPVAQDDSISGNENVALTYQMKGSDSDNDSLTYQIVSSTLPQTAMTTFNPNTGVMTWGNPAIGTYTMTYNVYDGLMYSDTKTITINIDQKDASGSVAPAGGGGGGGCGIIRDEQRKDYPVDPTLPLLTTLAVLVLMMKKYRGKMMKAAF